MSKALVSQKTPVVVADQSDNTGGGAPGDATFALRWLLEHQAEDVGIAIFYDPEDMRIAKAAGQGAALAVRLGGKMGVFSGDPLDIVATVLSIRSRLRIFGSIRGSIHGRMFPSEVSRRFSVHWY